MPKTWKDGVIPFTFDRSVSAHHRRRIEDDMTEIEDRTGCIEFVERDGERDHVVITRDIGNESQVGRAGGRQYLSFDNDCCKGRHNDRNTHLHELCHTIGLNHEHQRRDRDKYVKIDFDNIPKGSKLDFTKVPPKEDTCCGAFDYNSVMLYGPKEYQRDRRKPVLKSIRGNRIKEIDEKHGLSRGDVNKIKCMYDSD